MCHLVPQWHLPGWWEEEAMIHHGSLGLNHIIASNSATELVKVSSVTSKWHHVNPRPTKPFFVTWFTKGVVTTPLMNLKLTCPKYDCLVPWYKVGSPLSIDTKIMKIGQRMTSQWRFQTWPDSKSGFSVNIDQNWQKIHFFAKKVPNIGISPGFLHIKKGNGVSNMSWKF